MPKGILGAAAGIFFLLVAAASPALSQTYTLQKTIDEALSANLALKITQAKTEASEQIRKARQTDFYPTFSANYQYTYHDKERRSLGVLVRPKDEHTFSATISQPVFAGFSILNRYRIAELGLDLSKYQERSDRLGIVFSARNAYFSVLKAQKLVAVSEQAVSQLTANLKVSQDFFDVGMIPYNDLLKAEVELANARQDLIVARNGMEIARANFNTLLRRPISAPVELEDITDHSSFGLLLDSCLEAAQKGRPEIVIADLQLDIAEKDMETAKKDYYPSLSLQGTYYRQESGFLVGTGDPVGAITEPDGWDVSAVATWNFWEWGRTEYGVREKLSRLAQARFERSQVQDSIQLEVKEAFLRAQDSESNIVAVEKAVEQAQENYRITEERYKEQMATTKDVLDAQTLLSRTMTNYYSALYNYEIAKASLYRAMGREEMP